MSAPWPALGIEQTDDRIAIRKAYAARLKAIDVEADPAAFVALREALGKAMAWSAEQKWRAEQGLPPLEHWPEGPVDEPGAEAGEVPSPHGAAPAEAEPEPVQDVGPPAEQLPWVPPLPDEGNERFRRLDRLLFGLDGADPDSEELLAATREIIAYLDDESIDRAARIELWLAETALAASPRSNPILYLLVTHFGWDQAAGRIDQPWVFTEAVRRMQTYLVVDQVSRKSHKLHAAWKDLTSTKRRLGLTAFMRRDKVWNLLHAIRTECPWAEETLQPHRVALWEQRFRGGGGGFKGGWIFLGLMLVATLIWAGGAPQQVTTAPSASFGSSEALADPDLDIARAIQAAEGDRIDLSAIARENPAFYRRLNTIWRDARYSGYSFGSLSRDIDAELDQAFSDGLRTANDDLLLEHWRLVHDRLAFLSDRPDDCAAFILGSLRDYNFSPVLERRAAELRAALILNTPATPAIGSANPRVVIPPAILDDVGSLARLSEAEVRAALEGRGPNGPRCRAQIALIEVALARGERGRRLLREVTAAG